MNTTLKPAFAAKFENKELLAKAENKAIEHINYLIREAGSNVWGWERTMKAIASFTERMYNSPVQYGVI